MVGFLFRLVLRCMFCHTWNSNYSYTTQQIRGTLTRTILSVPVVIYYTFCMQFFVQEMRCVFLISFPITFVYKLPQMLSLVSSSEVFFNLYINRFNLEQTLSTSSFQLQCLYYQLIILLLQANNEQSRKKDIFYTRSFILIQVTANEALQGVIKKYCSIAILNHAPAAFSYEHQFLLLYNSFTLLRQISTSSPAFSNNT